MDHDPSARPISLDDHVPTLASILASRLRRVASRYYLRHFGVGIVEWRIVMCLGVQPGLSAIEICRRTDLDKAAVSRTLIELEGRGWTESTPLNEGGRQKQIWLTAEGRSLYARLGVAIAQRHETLLSTLSPEETRTLVDLMRRLIARADVLEAEQGEAGERDDDMAG
ncbi:MarR family winged helix-turn-helix transcriptional regulator [Aquabacterium sp. J223]|uniref:MarR family winged helix-turn-helix transcriptional regulator n=1 Tax=Aquabacterium sp. J223 TaxID=2898431 RepID=UPI0021AD59F5|nr:MarR family transcriptional regulator [Aquabacterium sp. J223]UUX94972.1 MarR family transcriptional regulator [Aquabacterium sp. J223]